MNNNNNNINKLLLSLLTNNGGGVKFVSFTYRSKGSGELARHTVLLNASLENAYKADLEALKELLPTLTKPVDIEACSAIIASVENSLEKGIGNNDAYTQADTWNFPIPSLPLAYDSEKNTWQIRGRSIQKKIFEEGVYKVVKSRPLTLAKKAIEKAIKAKRSTIRSYCVSELKGARIDGETLILD